MYNAGGEKHEGTKVHVACGDTNQQLFVVDIFSPHFFSAPLKPWQLPVFLFFLLLCFFIFTHLCCFFFLSLSVA